MCMCIYIAVPKVCLCILLNILYLFLFQGGQICGYPGCGKPCYLDPVSGKLFNFCGRSHAAEFKKLELSKPTATRGSNRYPKRRK